MSKKETIVVCFLMNAVLMVILFVGAIKHPEEKIHKDNTQIMLEDTNEEQKKSSLDSIDRLLDEYVIKKETEKQQEQKVEPLEKVAIEPEKTESKEQNLHEIKIVSGDSLDKISKRYGMSVKEIMKLNHLNSSTLQIGQALYVRKDVVKNSSEPEKRFYVVKSGESPWTIAAKNKLKLDELLRLNGLNQDSAKKLKPGDRLRIQ